METKHPMNDRLPEGTAWEGGKRKLARYLTEQSERLSSRAKKILLIICAIIVAIACVFMITEPFRSVGQGHAQLVAPAQVHLPPFMKDFPKAFFSEADYLFWMRIKHALDSLQEFDPKAYAKVVKGRETLVDSIQRVIDFYNRGRR